MSETDLEVAQLLCTRLCHDLAGPIGAVAAGVELIGDDPAMADAETISLIGDSSGAASRKIKFLRAAFGQAQPGPISDLQGLVAGYVAATSGPGGRIEIGWPAAAKLDEAGRAFGPTWHQLFLNLCLLALEAQPGCRGLDITFAIDGASASVALTARVGNGRAPAVRDDLRAAATVTESVGLTAKTVQAYLAGRLVRGAGGRLDVSPVEGGVSVVAVVPAAS